MCTAWRSAQAKTASIRQTVRLRLAPYTYTASQKTDSTAGKITLTNQRTNPKFALNLTKMGIDGTTTPLLGGVEFKLEKLNDDNTTFVTIGTGVTGSASAGTGQLTFADYPPAATA